MVYAFLIHTLSPGACHILYSATYASDLQQNTVNFPSADLREARKNYLSQVAHRVQSEYSFCSAVGGHTPNSNELLTPNSHEVLSLMKSGIFRLFAGEPFMSEKAVLWSGINNCAFTMICEENENRITAQSVLGLIIKFIHHHYEVISKPHEVLLKPDVIEAVLHHFLPSGQLIFMNHRIIRQFEKELNLTLNNKS